MKLPNLTIPLARLLRRSLLVAGVFVFAAFLRAQVPAGGTIEGRIFDPRRGEYVENARVTIEATKQEVLSDATGTYRLINVPPGNATLTIFYTGRGTQTEQVTVTAGAVAQRDITFAGGGRAAASGDVVKLDSFTVSSSKEMEGAAIAINEQRFAKNIMQVVSADEFGTIADGSIGEFMKFLPGITSDYTGGDARRFSINGVPAENVPISMGGFDMASAAGAGTGRQVELDQVSISNVARIEINRAPTPETSGNSLAGSVNLVPRSAFERNRPSYSYSVAWLMKDAERAFLHRSPGPGWGQYTYKIHPSVDFSAIVPVNKNFGFTISAGYSLQYTQQPNTAMQWVGAGLASNAAATALTGRPATTPQNPYLAVFSWRDSGKDTDRQSFNTTMDYRLSRYDRLSFGFQYGALREHFATRTQTFTINRVNPGNWTPDHTWGQASVFNAATNTNAGQMTVANGGRWRPGRTYSPSLRWFHDGPLWKAESGASYGSSRIHYQDIDRGAFNGMTIQRNNVQILFDDIFYLRPNRITVLDPSGRVVDPSNIDNYSLVSANSNRQRTYDTTRQAYANLRRDLMVREIPVSLKVGADIRMRARDLRGVGTETYTYVGADGRASTTPATQAGLINDDSPLPFLDTAYSERIPDWGMPKQQHVDNGKLWADYNVHQSNWTRNPVTEHTSVTNASKFAQEIISAAYFRGDFALLNKRLQIVTGLRAEQTNIKAQGPLNDPARAVLRDANGNPLRAANGTPLLFAAAGTLPYVQRTLIDRGTNAKKEYLRLFPSLNASYDITENLKGRFAYYQTVGRPNFNQYAGGLTVPNIELFNPSDRIVVNNVSIKAWQAETYMARLEYYFAGIGTINLSGFIRDYENFFQNVTAFTPPGFLEAFGLDEETYGVYQVQTQFNDPDPIRMKGWEIEYRRPLTFLPHWARGVSFSANFSSQRAKGTDNFLDMNPFVLNWGLSLTRPKFNLRINENYRGIQRRAVFTGASIEPGTYNYRTKRLYIDVSGEYYLRKSLGVFFALRNVGDATEDQKTYGPNTPDYAKFRQRDDYAPLWTAGIKGTF
ncbi:MAG TPA: TonB-dependent receptor [Opitutaceae bacterium]|nr:TonB-dependent receptor [Opitutaceae bacterium]